MFYVEFDVELRAWVRKCTPENEFESSTTVSGPLRLEIMDIIRCAVATLPFTEKSL